LELSLKRECAFEFLVPSRCVTSFKPLNQAPVILNLINLRLVQNLVLIWVPRSWPFWLTGLTELPLALARAGSGIGGLRVVIVPGFVLHAKEFVDRVDTQYQAIEVGSREFDV
jgi:hypothetical protein